MKIARTASRDRVTYSRVVFPQIFTVACEIKYFFSKCLTQTTDWFSGLKFCLLIKLPCRQTHCFFFTKRNCFCIQSHRICVLWFTVELAVAVLNKKIDRSCILFNFFLLSNMYFLNLTFLEHLLKGRPHGRTRSYFTSYFCTCTTFSASYTYKSTCVCTSTTSSNHVGFLYVVHVYDVQMYELAVFRWAYYQRWRFKSNGVFTRYNTINCFIY